MIDTAKANIFNVQNSMHWEISVHRRCRRHRFDPWVGKIPWRRARQPTPVLLPGKSHRQRSLAGYSPWGLKELDTIEHAHTYQTVTTIKARNIAITVKRFLSPTLLLLLSRVLRTLNI